MVCCEKRKEETYQDRQYTHTHTHTHTRTHNQTYITFESHEFNFRLITSKSNPDTDADSSPSTYCFDILGGPGDRRAERVPSKCEETKHSQHVLLVIADSAVVTALTTLTTLIYTKSKSMHLIVASYGHATHAYLLTGMFKNDAMTDMVSVGLWNKSSAPNISSWSRRKT